MKNAKKTVKVNLSSVGTSLDSGVGIPAHLCLPVRVLVLVGVVEAEGRVYGGALRHELDGTTWIS